MVFRAPTNLTARPLSAACTNSGRFSGEKQTTRLNSSLPVCTVASKYWWCFLDIFIGETPWRWPVTVSVSLIGRLLGLAIAKQNKRCDLRSEVRAIYICTSPGTRKTQSSRESTIGICSANHWLDQMINQSHQCIWYGRGQTVAVVSKSVYWQDRNM